MIYYRSFHSYCSEIISNYTNITFYNLNLFSFVSVDKKKKRGSDQLAALINYMSNDPTFAAGKFKDPHNGKRQMDVEWAELAANLNEMGPPKTVEQWKKVIINSYIISFFL